MEHRPEMLEPHRVIAARVRELRGRAGWTAQRLAEELNRVGIPWERAVVAKLETGRRQGISVEELLALAYVLNVAPVHLLVPPLASPDARWQVTPNGAVEVTPSTARAWVRGIGHINLTPAEGITERMYYFEAPREDQPYISPELEDPKIWVDGRDAYAEKDPPEEGRDG